MPEEDFAGVLLHLFWIRFAGGICVGELVFMQRRRAGNAVSGVIDHEGQIEDLLLACHIH